mmetsp:Transcript_5146/g.7931  ORF Transcript_5146/g.7931 Transcript_5146/m.7931 type:complete len:101 (+) Transcript_5146:287-589(+)
MEGSVIGGDRFGVNFSVTDALSSVVVGVAVLVGLGCVGWRELLSGVVTGGWGCSQVGNMLSSRRFGRQQGNKGRRWVAKVGVQWFFCCRRGPIVGSLVEK